MYRQIEVQTEICLSRFGLTVQEKCGKTGDSTKEGYQHGPESRAREL